MAWPFFWDWKEWEQHENLIYQKTVVGAVCLGSLPDCREISWFIFSLQWSVMYRPCEAGSIRCGVRRYPKWWADLPEAKSLRYLSISLNSWMWQNRYTSVSSKGKHRLSRVGLVLIRCKKPRIYLADGQEILQMAKNLPRKWPRIYLINDQGFTFTLLITNSHRLWVKIWILRFGCRFHGIKGRTRLYPVQLWGKAPPWPWVLPVLGRLQRQINPWSFAR